MSRKVVLPLIIISQFLCTSLWFAGNAVIPELVKSFHLASNAAGHLASSVQFGFITGTFIYAYLAIADRFPPSRVFFISALLASLANLAVVFYATNINSLLSLRAITGFFLAGIYPVGMKIASDHFGKDLGKVLGFLVGALVLGTALPHLVNNFSGALSWSLVFTFTSALCMIGGTLMLLIPKGRYNLSVNKKLTFNIPAIFRDKVFRSAAFGYFGHMWELYTFWAFVPFIVLTWLTANPVHNFNIRLLSFVIIAAGSLGCVLSGYLSQRYGNGKIAFIALSLSCICCFLSPFIHLMPPLVFIAFMLFWSSTVIADSPMFSSLVAQNAPVQFKGTALTLVTCIGFSITILSIEMINALKDILTPVYLFLFLIPGPLLGLIAMKNNLHPLVKKELDL